MPCSFPAGTDHIEASTRRRRSVRPSSESLRRLSARMRSKRSILLHWVADRVPPSPRSGSSEEGRRRGRADLALESAPVTKEGPHAPVMVQPRLVRDHVHVAAGAKYAADQRLAEVHAVHRSAAVAALDGPGGRERLALATAPARLGKVLLDDQQMHTLLVGGED